jgi:hypothetical protein
MSEPISPEIEAMLEKLSPELAAKLRDTGKLSPDDVADYIHGDSITPRIPAASTSAAAWRERLIRTVEFDDGLAIQFRLVNMLALLDSDGDAPNPLLSIVGQHMNGQQAIGKTMMEDPAALHSLRLMLKDVMVKVVVAPPLIEQGHEDGIHVDDIPLEKQMAVFDQLMGGAGLASAQAFRQKQISPVVAP